MKIVEIKAKDILPIASAATVITEQAVTFKGFCEYGVVIKCKRTNKEVLVPFSNISFLTVEETDEPEETQDIKAPETDVQVNAPGAAGDGGSEASSLYSAGGVPKGS